MAATNVDFYGLIRQKYKGHVLYSLNNVIFQTLRVFSPTIVSSPEQLFVEEAALLDKILDAEKSSVKMTCQYLWTDSMSKYRKIRGNEESPEDTAVFVAMLHLGINFMLKAHPDPFYNNLADLIATQMLYVFGREEDHLEKRCKNIFLKCCKAVNPLTERVQAWMRDYLSSNERLSKEIEALKDGRKNSPVKRPENCSFGLEIINKDEYNSTLQDFTDQLHKEGLIHEDDSVKEIKKVFSGHSCSVRIRWTGSPAILTSLMKRLKGSLVGNRPFISVCPEGVSFWYVVRQRFVDARNESDIEEFDQDNLRKNDEGESSEWIVTRLYDTLTGYVKIDNKDSLKRTHKKRTTTLKTYRKQAKPSGK